MKLPKNCKIEACASKEATRYVLTEPYLDIDAERQGKIVATDGMTMVVLPVELDDHDAEGWVSPDALKAARKVAGKLDTVSLTVNGKAEIPGGLTMPRTAIEYGEFPNWRQIQGSAEESLDFRRSGAGPVIDAAREAGIVDPENKVRGVTKIAFNAKLLSNIAAALGTDGVVLEITDELGVITVKPSGNRPGVGYLMTLRMA